MLRALSFAMGFGNDLDIETGPMPLTVINTFVIVLIRASQMVFAQMIIAAARGFKQNKFVGIINPRHML